MRVAAKDSVSTGRTERDKRSMAVTLLQREKPACIYLIGGLLAQLKRIQKGQLWGCRRYRIVPYCIFTVLRQNGIDVCHVDNPSYQVLLIDLDARLATIGLHEVIEFVELLLAGIDRNFYGFTAFYSITALQFYRIAVLCGRCSILLGHATAFLNKLCVGVWSSRHDLCHLPPFHKCRCESIPISS